VTPAPGNTHAVGYVGLGSGGFVLVALTRLFWRLEDPVWPLALYDEHATHRIGHATVEFYALIAALVVAIVIAVLAAYFGKPRTVP
jgi:hypothetical protein